MDAVFCVRVTPGGDDAVGQIGSNSVNMGRMERRLQVSWTLRKADDLVGRVIFLESGGEELRREHFQMVMDGKDGGFSVKMLL